VAQPVVVQPYLPGQVHKRRGKTQQAQRRQRQIPQAARQQQRRRKQKQKQHQGMCQVLRQLLRGHDLLRQAQMAAPQRRAV